VAAAGAGADTTHASAAKLSLRAFHKVDPTPARLRGDMPAHGPFCKRDVAETAAWQQIEPVC